MRGERNRGSLQFVRGALSSALNKVGLVEDRKASSKEPEDGIYGRENKGG